MSAAQPCTHAELLDLADRLVRVAEGEDPATVEAAALQLLAAFVEHSLAEQPDLARLPAETSRMLARGQQRVIERLVEVLVATAVQDGCSCQAIAHEVSDQLTLQVVDELDEQVGR